MSTAISGETIARGLRLRAAGQGRWHGQCPCCRYKSGFSVTERRGEALLLYCHPNRCEFADLIAALRKLGLGRVPPGGVGAVGK